MASTEARNTPSSESETLKTEWLDRLAHLVDAVETWAKDLDWSTRRIDKKMKDSKVGAYRAPALVIQKDTTRGILEPIARSTIGSEGVVDLYLMPAYDDIASLYYFDGEWRIHHSFPGSASMSTVDKSESVRLTGETFRYVLEEMIKYAEQQV